MGSEWPTVSIGELANITSSKRIFASDYCTSGVPFYRSKEIIEKAKGNSISTELFISRKKFEEIKNKFGAPKANDILLTSVGTLGVPYLVCPNEEFYFKDGNLTWLQTSTSDACPRFVYIWLRSGIAKRAIDEVTIGSTQQALTIVALKSLKVNLPPLPEQKAIAHILGSLDDKIELNRRMNATLEGMAQALFKSWFVDFDPVLDNALAAGNPIPEELTERAELRRQALAKGTANREAAKQFPAAFWLTEEIGWIPEGCEVKPLAEIADVIDCSHSKKPEPVGESANILLQVYNVASGGKMDFDKSYFIIDEDYREWTKRMELRGGDLVVTKTGRVGAVGQMPKGKQAAMGRNMVGIRARHGITLPEFLRDCLLSERMRLEMTKNTNDGTILKSLHVKSIQALKAIVPSFDLVGYYSNNVGSLHKKIEYNIAESETLTKLRDTLLPKLISGELRIPKAEKLTEEAMA